MFRSLKAVLVLFAACGTWSCQSPTDPAVDVTEFVETTVAPSPTAASGPTGRFYTYVPSNNQPNEQREFDWRTSFSVGVTLNSHANDDKFNVEFPVKISAATVKVQQASGGIITPPTGSDGEHYEFDFQVATNTFPAANNSVNMSFDVWYDLPNLRREALVTVTLAFTDNASRSFSRTVEVRVAP